MHISFIMGSYPSPARPSGGVFVQQFAWAMARQGHECDVVSPTSFVDRRYGELPPRYAVESAGGVAEVSVYRPRYLSFSSKNLGLTHTGRWTHLTFQRAVFRALRDGQHKPDVLYGHFLYHAGRTAVMVGRRLGIPSVVGVGEGTFWTIEPFGLRRARNHFRSADGILAVSSDIRDKLINQLGIPEAKIRVEPNGVDQTRFFPMNRESARRRLGLSRDAFLVAFVGAFHPDKGIRELVRAADGLHGVGLLLLGSGSVTLASRAIVRRGPVAPADVPLWLGAADIFVLPTRIEGSCNAVVEAMACGLPIVTARGRHMDDLVDNDVAIRVDPTDVTEIRTAIALLRDDPRKREAMSHACMAAAKRFDINARAMRVGEWLATIVDRSSAAPVAASRSLK